MTCGYGIDAIDAARKNKLRGTSHVERRVKTNLKAPSEALAHSAAEQWLRIVEIRRLRK
jgi:hypothetical protein